MLGYRHAAVLSVGMLFVLPSFSSAQNTEPIPGLDLPSFDVAVDLPGIPDIPDIPGLDLPSIELSLSFETPFFDVEVEVQQIPGDPIRDVDITVKTKPPPPPPPLPDDEEFCFFGVIFC